MSRKKKLTVDEWMLIGRDMRTLDEIINRVCVAISPAVDAKIADKLDRIGSGPLARIRTTLEAHAIMSHPSRASVFMDAFYCHSSNRDTEAEKS